MGRFLPVLGLVLGAEVPGGLAILLGTLIPVGLAVLMFPPVISRPTSLVSVSGYRLSPDHENNWLQLGDVEVVLSAPKSMIQKNLNKKKPKC